MTRLHWRLVQFLMVFHERLTMVAVKNARSLQSNSSVILKAVRNRSEQSGGPEDRPEPPRAYGAPEPSQNVWRPSSNTDNCPKMSRGRPSGTS